MFQTLVTENVFVVQAYTSFLQATPKEIPFAAFVSLLTLDLQIHGGKSRDMSPLLVEARPARLLACFFLALSFQGFSLNFGSFFPGHPGPRSASLSVCQTPNVGKVATKLSTTTQGHTPL